MKDEERLKFVANEYEKKLRELMTEEDFMAFATDVARRAFRKEIEQSPSEEFKKMVFDNWDEITR